MNANSIPGSDWFTTIRCILKRSHLVSYQIAEEELKKMLENTPQAQAEHTKEQTKSAQCDFNNSANQCPGSSLVTKSPGAGITEVTDYVSQSYMKDLTDQQNERIDKITSNQDIMIQNQQAIINTFEHLPDRENMLKIMQRLANLEGMLRTTNNPISNILPSKTANQNVLLPTREDIFFDPIDTFGELETLEAKLSNTLEMEECVRKFSYVCGRKGSGNAINNCYILVDKIFTRKFMTLCSWAGGARDGKEKIPFKIYKNVINLFFKVVRLADDDFTLIDCEDFFKAVIKNSTKRNESTLSRSSRSKRRPSALSYKSRKLGKETQELRNIVAAESIKRISHEEDTRSNIADIADHCNEMFDPYAELCVKEEDEGK